MDPNYTLPKKGTDPTPQTGKPVPSNRLSGADPVSPEATQARLRADPIIDNWIQAQRQNVANSATNFHHAALDHPDANVRYQNLYGSERITVEPKPIYPEEPAAPEPEAAPPTYPIPPIPQPPGIPKPILPSSGYLLVLFQTQDQQGGQVAQVAAVSMSGFGSTSFSADYVGTVHGGKFVARPGCILPTLQYHLGQTDFVMMPLDLSGQRSASTHYLMSLALTDGIATQTPAGGMPAMNGTETNIMTMGGAFRFANGAFTQTRSMPVDAVPAGEAYLSQAICPHAIDSDGTSYYFPKLSGQCYIQPSPKCLVAYQPGLDYNAKLTAATKTQSDQFPKTNTYSALTCYTQIYTDETRIGPSQADVNETQTYNIKTTAIQVGPTAQVPSIVSQSFYGRGDYAVLPDVVDMKVAYATQDFISYDLGTNQNISIGGPVGASDTSNRFPYQSVSQNSGGPSVYFMSFSGLARFTDRKQQNSDKTKANVIARASLTHSFNVNDTPIDEIGKDNIIKQYSVAGYFGPTQPPLPQPPFSDGELSAYQDAFRTAMTTYTGVNAFQTYTCTPLVITLSSEGGGSTSATGDAPDGSGFPCPRDALTAIGDGESAAIYLHTPFSLSFDETLTSEYEVHWGTVTLTYNFTADKTTAGETPIPPDTLVVHSFPPMLGAAGWWTKVTGSSNAVTVYTPYEIHNNAQDQLKSFTPWLSLSNGKHTLQAYYVDQQPFVFVDGGGSNVASGIAAACGCRPTEMVSMVMGVKLDTIKALAGIKPVSYTSTQGGDPGPPPGQGFLPLV